MYVSEDDEAMKLIDFGLANRVKLLDFRGGALNPHKNTPRAIEKAVGLTTPCGTPHYAAPELLNRKPYGASVDCWSLGVIIYLLLCGFPPFFDTDLKNLYHMICNAKFAFPSPFWDNVSSYAKDLIEKLLTVEPLQRYTASQVLEHPWITRDYSSTESDDSSEDIVNENDHDDENETYNDYSPDFDTTPNTMETEDVIQNTPDDDNMVEMQEMQEMQEIQSNNKSRDSDADSTPGLHPGVTSNDTIKRVPSPRSGDDTEDASLITPSVSSAPRSGKAELDNNLSASGNSNAGESKKAKPRLSNKGSSVRKYDTLGGAGYTRNRQKSIDSNASSEPNSPQMSAAGILVANPLTPAESLSTKPVAEKTSSSGKEEVLSTPSGIYKGDKSDKSGKTSKNTSNAYNTPMTESEHIEIEPDTPETPVTPAVDLGGPVMPTMSKSYQLEHERDYSDDMYSDEDSSDGMTHVIQKAHTTLVEHVPKMAISPKSHDPTMESTRPGTAKAKAKPKHINVNTATDGQMFSHTRDRSRTSYKDNEMDGLQEMMQEVEQQRSREKRKNKDRIKHGKSKSKPKGKSKSKSKNPRHSTKVNPTKNKRIRTKTTGEASPRATVTGGGGGASHRGHGHDGRYNHSDIATIREHTVMKSGGNENVDDEIYDDNFDPDEIRRARSSNIESNKPISLKRHSSQLPQKSGLPKDRTLFKRQTSVRDTTPRAGRRGRSKDGRRRKGKRDSRQQRTFTTSNPASPQHRHPPNRRSGKHSKKGHHGHGGANNSNLAYMVEGTIFQIQRQQLKKQRMEILQEQNELQRLSKQITFQRDSLRIDREMFEVEFFYINIVVFLFFVCVW